MFSYYGSKSKIVHLYPRPKFDKVIEPFAGSARYALRYFDRDVILVDKYDKIIAIWKYLQMASEKDILGLPDVNPGETSAQHTWLSDVERWLIGFCLARGTSTPQYQSGVMNDWNSNRQDIAKQLFKIRHWKFIHGTYECLANVEATWFIDPPYFQGGEHYKHPTKHLNFPDLATFATSRNGQVIVCENSAATWMPFMPLKRMHGSMKSTMEVWWTNEPEPIQQGLFFSL